MTSDLAGPSDAGDFADKLATRTDEIIAHLQADRPVALAEINKLECDARALYPAGGLLLEQHVSLSKLLRRCVRKQQRERALGLAWSASVRVIAHRYRWRAPVRARARARRRRTSRSLKRTSSCDDGHARSTGGAR